MDDEEQRMMKRFAELSARAGQREKWMYSDFLGMAGQEALRRTRLPAGGAPWVLCGGCEGAERALAAFGSEELCGGPPSPPAVWVRVRPVSARFAEPLTHRDYLGALMALEIKREALGDIVAAEDGAAVFCLASVAPLLLQELTEVRRTTVACAVGPAPESAGTPPEPKTLTVASLRLDAVLSEVYSLSRADSRALVEQQRVLLNGRTASSPSAELRDGDVVSARGFGRFAYLGTQGRTRKDRARITVRIY